MIDIDLEKLNAAIKAIDSLNGSIKDYRKFFDVFGVKLENEDGSYKSLDDIFTEASRSPLARKLRMMLNK